MQDLETRGRPVKVFLFADESVCKMEKCRPGCKQNVNILCKHRFDFETHVFPNDIFSVQGSLDFEVILNCFDYIARIKRNKIEKIQQRRTARKKFIILTKDEKFLQEAASKTKETKRQNLVFDTQNQCVSREGVFLYVVYFKCEGDKQKRGGQRLCIISELNRRFCEGLAPF